MKRIILSALIVFTLLPTYAQKPLTLEDCRSMALASNKSVQIAEQSIIASEEMKKAAFANFFPNLSGIGSYNYNQKNISLLAEDALLPIGTKMSDGSFGFTADQVSNNWTLIGGTPVPLDANGKPFNPKEHPEKILWKNYAYLPKDAMAFDMHHVFVGGISLVQPIYMGGKIRELYNLSNFNKELAKNQQETKTLDLLVSVDEAYWRVVSLESKVKLATQYRDLIAKIDTNMTEMIREGVSTKAEGLKIKVKLNEAEVSLTKALDGLRLSRMALNQLCGMPLNSEVLLAEQNIESQILINNNQNIEQAILKRSEVRSLIQLENIAKSGERLSLSRFMPNIVLTGSYLLSNPNVYNGFNKKFDGMFTAGLVLQLPIFHGFERTHTLRAAQAYTKIATLQLEEVKEKMELQIAMCQDKIEESVKKQSSTKKNIEQAEENLRYANEGFEAGTIPSTDLMAAQTAWLTAKSEYIDATIEVRLSQVYLQKSLGEIQLPTIKKNKN